MSQNPEKKNPEKDKGSARTRFKNLEKDVAVYSEMDSSMKRFQDFNRIDETVRKQRRAKVEISPEQSSPSCMAVAKEINDGSTEEVCSSEMPNNRTNNENKRYQNDADVVEKGPKTQHNVTQKGPNNDINGKSTKFGSTASVIVPENGTNMLSSGPKNVPISIEVGTKNETIDRRESPKNETITLNISSEDIREYEDLASPVFVFLQNKILSSTLSEHQKLVLSLVAQRHCITGENPVLLAGNELRQLLSKNRNTVSTIFNKERWPEEWVYVTSVKGPNGGYSIYLLDEFLKINEIPKDSLLIDSLMEKEYINQTLSSASGDPARVAIDNGADIERVFFKDPTRCWSPLLQDFPNTTKSLIIKVLILYLAGFPLEKLTRELLKTIAQTSPEDLALIWTHITYIMKGQESIRSPASYLKKAISNFNQDVVTAKNITESEEIRELADICAREIFFVPSLKKLKALAKHLSIKTDGINRRQVMEARISLEVRKVLQRINKTLEDLKMLDYTISREFERSI